MTSLLDPLRREQADLTSLRARLVERAHTEGLLDVAYRTIDTPVGSLLLAATPMGLVRVAFAVEGHDLVLADLARRISPRVLRAPRQLDDAAAALEGYLEGRLHSLVLPLDLQLARGFRRDVLAHLGDIGYGRTASYAQLAAAAGRPRAVRAAASACATNPLPIVLPCHRVVRSDGTLGGYLAGPEVKARLLALEGSGGGKPEDSTSGG